MKLTSEMIKQRAKEIGLDAIGIGNIERYHEAPPLMDPKNYFPGAKSVIVTAMRIPRGSYRGIEEGTHWHNYTYYSYNRLNTVIRPRLTYKIASFIEDFGWEAVPCYPGVPERNPMREPVAEGKLPSDIVMQIRLMGVGAGVGEMGHSKVFMTPEFGPRVRLGLILTDAELEPDPIIEPRSICNMCGKCVKDCPGNAIPPVKEKDKRIKVHIGDKTIEWGDVHMGRCTLTHHGFNNEISPFHKKAFPNMEYDVRNAHVTEEEAYRLCYPMATAKWSNTVWENNDPSIIKFYSYVMNHVGYFALCGARGCIRACMINLEKRGRVTNQFHNQFQRKDPWILDNKIDPEEMRGVINPFREDYLDSVDPKLRKNEQKEMLFKD